MNIPSVSNLIISFRGSTQQAFDISFVMNLVKITPPIFIVIFI